MISKDMQAIDKSEMKVRIAKEIARTEKQIEEYRELSKPVAPENAIGRISRMDAINNKSITEAALRKAQDKIKKLRIALSHVDDQDFGRCIRCHALIPIERILFMPQARTCVKCSH